MVSYSGFCSVRCFRSRLDRMGKADLEEKAKVTIREYMLRQNRPYSVNDVMTNLQKEFGKALVQKTMDALVLDGALCEKAVSKQKLYWANQNQFPAVDEAELKQLDQEIAEKEKVLKESQAEMKTLEEQLRTQSAALTTEDILREISTLKPSVEIKKGQLVELQIPGKPTVSSEEKQKLEKLRDGHVKEWRKRKRMATEILDTILENCEKKKKDLLEEIGIETDEDSGVKCP